MSENKSNNKLVLWLIPFLLVGIAIGLRNGGVKDDLVELKNSFYSLEAQYKVFREDILAVKIMVKRCGAEIDE